MITHPPGLWGMNKPSAYAVTAAVLVIVALALSAVLVSAGSVPSPLHPRTGAAGPFSRATALPPNPAVCNQTGTTLKVSAGPGDMHDTLLNDYDTLGAAGGGTIKLGPGTFYVNETLNFARYSNVSIQGSGIGRTILSLPPSPVGNFTGSSGVPVGQFNQSLGGPVNGSSANFIQVSGGTPIDNFEMCDLTIDAQATNASEDWAGSLIMDSSGGFHHVYSDIAEVNFFGPSTTPNGLHLESSPSGKAPGTGYVIDNLSASQDAVPFENYPGYGGGPNFLNVGAVVNCTLSGVVGIGLVAFELAPPQGCLVENWNVTGHVLIDPSQGGSWGGTLFQNVTVDANGTPSPNALDATVANGTGGGPHSNFTALRWNDDQFDGNVIGGVNLVDVENSSFDGGLNSTPSVFTGSIVVWTNPSPQGLGLPILVRGPPCGAQSAVISGDRFVFPNGTNGRDPFRLTAPTTVWWNDTVAINGITYGYLFNAPDLSLDANSSFSALTYESLGNGSPPALVLFDIVGSPGFEDLGVAVTDLTGIYNDLPEYVPTTPLGLTGAPDGPTQIGLSWNASSGPLTNYTVYVGTNPSALLTSYSVGTQSEYPVVGLAPGTGYYFAVEAWNYSFHSGLSPTIEVATPPMSLYAPGTPSGLRVLSRGLSEIDVAWNASTGNVTNYTVYEGTESNSLPTSISVGDVTHFAFTGLLPATAYYFGVRAWNNSYGSSMSSPMEATTLSTPVYAPGTPSGLSVVYSGLTELELLWNRSSGNVTNYTLYEGTSPQNLDLRFSTGLSTKLNVTGLVPATTYFFAVQAWNGSYASLRSGVVNATTTSPGGAPPPGSPTTPFDWIVVGGTVIITILVVIGPLAVVGYRRALVSPIGPGPRAHRSASAAVSSLRGRPGASGPAR